MAGKLGWIFFPALLLLSILSGTLCLSLMENIQMQKEKLKSDDAIRIPLDDRDDGLDQVEPPDHLKAVKFERDGEINANYHKEVFLGAEAEKFQNGDYKLEEQRQKLQEIFKAVDLNSDGILNEEELTLWVLTKTREHFYEARMSNELMFKKLDREKNGRVTWNEFISYYLSEKGMNRETVFQQLEAGETVDVPDKSLVQTIEDLRDKWIQVQDAGEKSLTALQFLDFEHPETSKTTLAYMVEDILHDMDTDNSKDLSVQEYVALPPETDVDAFNDVWIVERRKEFREVLDVNKDGRVTTEELQAYLDPLSKSMAAQEARQLIGFGDTNENGELTLEEVMENAEYYTGSKLYNYALSVHEEF